MTILLTGGTGKTSTCLASLLKASNIPYILASRNPGPSATNAVKFDWDDATTFDNPFSVSNQKKITAVYLVQPQSQNPSQPMIDFVDVAVAHGVKRFVVLTGSGDEMGSPYHAGGVWKYLDDKKLEYCVLRATWFMENFSAWQHIASIKSEGKIYTACGDGKTPFVSAGDIAGVAFHALTSEKPLDTTYRILGPELLTHDEVAIKLGAELSRKIENVKISGDESEKRWKALGLPDGAAQFMSSIEVKTANGAEERANDTVEQVTGKPAQSFEDWVKENKSVWA